MTERRHTAPRSSWVGASALAAVVLALARAAAAQEPGEAERAEAEALCRAGRAQEDAARQYFPLDPSRALTSLEDAIDLYERVAHDWPELACVAADEQAQHASFRAVLVRRVEAARAVPREEQRRMLLANLTLALDGPATFFALGLALQLGPTMDAAAQYEAVTSGCPLGNVDEARHRWVGLEVVSWSLISLGLACFVVGEIALVVCSARPDRCRRPRPGRG